MEYNKYTESIFVKPRLYVIFLLIILREEVELGHVVRNSNFEQSILQRSSQETSPDSCFSRFSEYQLFHDSISYFIE